jgi:hypothetical protein
MFNQPAGGGVYFRPRDHEGNLILVIEAYSEETRYDDMRKGDVREVVVDLVDLDSDTPELLEGVILAHKGLTNKIKTLGPVMLLGRIGTVDTKVGTAFVFQRFTEDDEAQATAWVEANKTRPTFSSGSDTTKGKATRAEKTKSKADEDPFATPDK